MSGAPRSRKSSGKSASGKPDGPLPVNKKQDWPTEGVVTVQRNTHHCGYCDFPNDGLGRYAWFIRRHVEQVHIPEMPNLHLNKGWAGAPNGNKNRKSNRRAQKMAMRAANSTAGSTPVFTPEATPAPALTQEMLFTTPPAATMSDMTGSITSTPDISLFTPPTASIVIPADWTAILEDLQDTIDTTTAAVHAAQREQTPAVDEGVSIPEQATPNASTEYDPTDLIRYSPWNTPQKARRTDMAIESIPPSWDKKETTDLAIGSINELIGTWCNPSGLTEQEMAYVLENFLDAFKAAMPFAPVM